MKENTFSEFHKTTLGLLKLLFSLSEEQLNFQPKEGWSAGQFGEHLLKSYAFVETLNGKTIETERPMDKKVEQIKALFSDTSIKMDSPKAILPSKGKIDKKHLIKKLEDRIEQIKKVIQTEDLALTCVDFIIPEYGEFTRFEWIWFNIYHTQRHIQQLENMIVSNNITKQMKTLNIIQKYFSCYETSDKETLETLLHDRFEFSSPHDRRLDKVSYFERCWGFNTRVKQYQILEFIENNEEAFLSYRAVTYDNLEIENAEYFDIKDGKILKIKVYYGNLPEK